MLSAQGLWSLSFLRLLPAVGFHVPTGGNVLPGDTGELAASWVHCSFTCFTFFQRLQDVPSLVSLAQCCGLRKQLFFGFTSSWGMKGPYVSGFGDEP